MTRKYRCGTCLELGLPFAKPRDYAPDAMFCNIAFRMTGLLAAERGKGGRCLYTKHELLAARALLGLLRELNPDTLTCGQCRIAIPSADSLLCPLVGKHWGCHPLHGPEDECEWDMPGPKLDELCDWLDELIRIRWAVPPPAPKRPGAVETRP